MSAITIQEPTKVRNRARIHNPEVVTADQIQSKRRAFTRAKSQVIQAFWAFLLCGAVTYLGLALIGHMLAEGQRAEVKSMTKPLKIAREANQEAQVLFASDESTKAIDNWARERGFIAPGAPSEKMKESTLVAQL